MNELLKVLEFTADKTQTLVSAQSVAGEPIVIGEVTIIPVSKLSCGFSGGGSDLPSGKSDRFLAGAGAKVTVTPLSFLAICGNEVKVLNIRSETTSKHGLIAALKPLAVQFQDMVKKKNGGAK